MWQSLAAIHAAAPTCGLIENVSGLRVAHEGEQSPLEVIQQELAKSGYVSRVLELNMETFATVCRG
eukprot:4011887-Amphidinium_carterae.1